MITFDVVVTGGEIGRALAEDAEEMTYALREMVKESPGPLGDLIAAISWGDHAEIATWLRALADRIEAGKTHELYHP